ncbi:MAG: heavy metal translocating P-type ATPase [Verrucomicrobia bacterium]|nr:heavy metal translocating P-type ATPase [Verrucomicrobiota bacterium]MBU6446096.1 heavy metal translocating P-type ATPase [Verrucomicrobiota bacterium]
MSNFLKNDPLPLLALTGLIVGLIFYLPLHRPEVGHWIWLATLVVGGVPIVYQTLKGMLRGRFASDIVAMLAILTALIMDEAFAGAVVVLMQSGGEALESYGLRRASYSLEALLKRAPRFAFRKQEGTLHQIDVKEVRVGDILMVRPGDLIPVDGTILSGSAEIDEAALTGEPLPRSKTSNDAVFSGMIDVNGVFEMRADKTSEQSQYQKIVELVRKAQLEKAPIQRLADRYAIFFTPLALAISVLGYLITHDATTVLAVLVVATPCPLILATPLAILCGINQSAKSGIIVKGGAPMEQVGNTKIAVFDKTGTITYGTPFVEEIVPLNHESADDLLYQTACIEQLSSHSIAKAVVEKAGKKLRVPQGFQESPGRGVEADLDGAHFTIGSYAFLEEKLGAKCYVNCEEAIQRYFAQEKLLVFIAKNALCVGIFVISDRIRPGIPTLIEKLHTLGVKEVVMLTGDSQKNAALIAKEAGIQNFKAELLPEQKVDIVAKLKERANVTMIGDGINDAPALATATTGIAMGALGSAISAESADIVLLVDDVTKVGEAIAISQRTIHIAKESIFIGMGLSLLLMIIASFGLIVPPVGAMLQEVIDFAVILNALRVR